MRNLIDWTLFGLLTFLDQAFPGWSRPARVGGDYLTDESVNYWLCAERCRRQRD